MPVPDSELKTTWADEVEEGEGGVTTTKKVDPKSPLPEATEEFKGDMKISTEYKINDDGKKVKLTRYYKIEKHIVSKTVAQRKTWKKFGKSRGDKPGPDPATTVVTEDVFMQFISGKEESEKLEQDPLDKLKASTKGVKCRICKEEHWTTQCPYKDSLGPLQEAMKTSEEAGKPGAPSAPMDDKRGPGGAAPQKYIAPGLRDGGNRKGESMQMGRRGDETAAIRVSNLSENTTEKDLEELFKPMGRIARIFLAKDKTTGICKGFAFINYHRREDAAKAISALNGYGYDHLILNVEWSKPTNP